MTDNSHVWTPDLGDHFGDKFGDEIWDLKGAGIFSIFLLGVKIRLIRHIIIPCDVTACRGKLYKESAWMTESVVDCLGARTSLEFYPLCELGSW
ncbi:hypothetical protein AVEN_9046-1 [Araneus ventricosus]|uniref:Uncharacterized protein n=1 Tax=Araneus ventricosus TaxID=182803 RepID=A0A4Y2NGX6_ARAVE|nr:hypothetical protein AVEN_9046-1 [Araneus ventricosus]